MRLIMCFVAGLLLITPPISMAESYLYKNIILEMPDGWSIYQDTYSDVGIQFRQKDTDNLIAFILRAELLIDGTDPGALLKNHPVEHPVSSVQIGNYSGYFVTFMSKGKCMANWFLGDGRDLLVAHFKGDCSSVDYTAVISVIESIENRAHAIN
ncbi:hypothetical protein [Microbulbifer sp. GL-2]|uniref:hypothetical protein n=1 Tax=Microbulbifer sp. GL-2 TaxID=2591606 RepID=UPI001163CBDE|nr:hypothetical protein [Microbulbifer sp. GL-2]BBM02114.1 hypothetical protein GL2_21880 [Microbulbifer sp. GL-2]